MQLDKDMGADRDKGAGPIVFGTIIASETGLAPGFQLCNTF